MRSFNLFNLQ